MIYVQEKMKAKTRIWDEKGRRKGQEEEGKRIERGIPEELWVEVFYFLIILFVYSLLNRMTDFVIKGIT